MSTQTYDIPRKEGQARLSVNANTTGLAITLIVGHGCFAATVPLSREQAKALAKALGDAVEFAYCSVVRTPRQPHRLNYSQNWGEGEV